MSAKEDTQLLKGVTSLDGISDTGTRHAFVMKVYGILCAQLALTTLLGGVIMNWGEPMMKTNPGMVLFLMFASLAVSIAMLCVFMCNPMLMRQYPTNYIILFVFTVAESVMVGFICIQYTKESVLIVTGITAFVVFGLTLFACQTTYDFTGFGPYLMVALLVLSGFSFVLFLGSMLGLGSSPAFQTLRLVYSAFGAMLFSFYIVYDTQLIVGGKHGSSRENQISIDDYCMAAITLYIDIIQLFLMLLQLFGQRR
jgi:FtsH-binding integral membrane protein